MKKLIIMSIVIGIIIVGYFIYIFIPVWSICENGFYSKYPNKDVVDANSIYYDSNNNELGSCGFWNGDTTTCLDIRKKAGQCTETNFLKFFFIKKLGL